MGWEYSDEPPEHWVAPEFPEGVWDGWRGIDYDRTTYGVGFGSTAYVLVPGHISVDENGVIPTSRFTLSLVGGDNELKGFVAADPDDNPETVEGLGLKQVGGRGEGMRGGEARTDAEGNFIGEAQTALSFEGDTTLAPSTMGIGFVNLSTTHEGFSQSAKLFFNYSNLDQEPLFRGVVDDDVNIRDNSITYNIENPIDYSEAEAVGLRAKFGWDPTLGTGAYTNAYMDGFDRSIHKIVEALVTTYPINLATFPRTPPMKIRRKQLSLIRNKEKAEDEMPSGAEAVTSTVTSGDMPSSY
jgi:hypothetical protein